MTKPRPTDDLIVDPRMQAALYRTAARAAVDYIQARLDLEADRLIELGERRAFDDVGLAEYGDDTFHLPHDLKVDELDAELADAIFYAVTVIVEPLIAELVTRSRTA